jgi:hypothetical protein
MDKNIEVNVIKNEDDKIFNELREKSDRAVAIKELEDKIASMKKDKLAKCKAAKEQLVEMLKVTVDKYRTATGTAEALRVLRFTAGKDNVPILDANVLAREMAIETDKMREKAEKLSYAEMDKLCNGFYEKDCKVESAYDLAFEMMRIDLCRNVGGSAEDMVEFIKRTQEEIDATGEELKKLKAKKED